MVCKTSTRPRRTWAGFKGSLLSGVALGLFFGFAGSAKAQQYETISWLQQNGNYDSTSYTTTGVVSAVLSQPETLNGITYNAWAYYVQDSTGGMDMYGALPSGGSVTSIAPGDLVSVTGLYEPYHFIPEMGNFTSLSIVGTAAVPAPKVETISYINGDIAANIVQGSQTNGTTSILPNDLAGYMITLKNVQITGEGAQFLATNSPNGAQVADTQGNNMTFYYWPTSYSSANQNLYGASVPTGFVNMTGFVSAYGNSNIPEFAPISISSSLGPPVLWQPQSGANSWNGTTASFLVTSAGTYTAVTTNSAATFDDTGLALSGGSTVNVAGGTGSVSAYSVVVSNSAGTYNFTGGTVTAPVTKTGGGTMLINNSFVGAVSVTGGSVNGVFYATGGTLGGSGTIYGSLTVGGSAGPAYVTPGATTSTVGMLTINNQVGGYSSANFSAGGTYVWKLGSLVDNSNGTPGVNWDVLNLGYAGGASGIGGGGVNFSGSSQLAISFASSSQIPGNGNAFWNSNHSWVIAGSCDFVQGFLAPQLGGTIVNNSLYSSAGTFSFAGDTAYDLVLNWTSAQETPRSLLWSNGSSTQLVDSSGTWCNGPSNAMWTNGSSPGLSFSSARADNVTFGNPSGSGGVATVTLSGAVTTGSITINGSNAADYTIQGIGSANNSAGTLTIENGIVSLAQSATLTRIKDIVLGYSQTWSLGSGTLTVTSGAGASAILQDTSSLLTVAGPGTLNLGVAGQYGGLVLTNSAVVNNTKLGGSKVLPTDAPFTMAAGTQFNFPAAGVSETIGALNGAGTINLGSATASSILTYGQQDSSNETFSGSIVGNGSGGQLVFQGGGSSLLSGVNTFSGSVAVNSGGGELLVASDSGLGNFSNPVSVDNNGALGAIGSFSSSRTLNFGTNTTGNNDEVLDVVGSNTVLTLTGPITVGASASEGTLTVNSTKGLEGTAGMLVLTNSNDNLIYCGAVALSFGTLSVNSPAILGTTPISFLGTHDGSTLLFAGGGTYVNSMSFPVIGNRPIYLNTDGNNVTLTGAISAMGNESEYYTVDVHKAGLGTLTLACSTPGPGNIGNLYVDQGALVVSTSAYSSNSALQNESPFGGSSGGYIYVASASSLQLANAQLGLNADVAANGVSMPTLDLYSGSGGTTSVGATLLSSGSSTYENGGVEVRLNYSGTAAVTNDIGNLSNYGSGSVTIAALGAGSVLSIGSAVHQYDPGSTFLGNYGGNAVMTGPATYADDPNKLVVVHVTGAGVVQLQSGGVTSNTTFGGEWSVDSGGVLEVGPYPLSTGVWNGPYGQLFNALGFKTLDGQTTGVSGTQTVNGDPDMPNGVTVNLGGMFVVAVDQVNYTYRSEGYNNGTDPNSIAEFGVNGTPNYFRNPITLSGGTLAVSGNEVDMSLSSGLPITAGSTAVTGLFGGSFIVSPGTSTIATYDVLGSTGTRTIELLGGSRVLANSTAAYAAGTTISYSTNWSANSVLNVDGGTAGGGVFELLRDAGGVVTVGSNASINIINGATVLVGDTSPFGDAYSATQNSDSGGGLYDAVSGNSVNFTGTNGHLVFSRTDNITYRGNIGGAVDLTQDGTGTLVLTGSNNYTGGTYLPSGTVDVDAASAIPTNGNIYVGNVGEFGAVVVAGIATPAGTATVPEPGSLLLLLGATGFGAAVACRRWAWKTRLRS